VKIVLESLENDKIRYEVGAMSTVIEIDDLDKLFEIVKKAHQKVIDAGAKRVLTDLKIDDRKDKDATIATKLESVTRK
jgi:uncharacterized protein (TIGR00106 family)